VTFEIGEPELEDDDDVCEHGVPFSDDCEDCEELEDEDDEDLDDDELEDEDEDAS
jgi:hypothetical protein